MRAVAVVVAFLLCPAFAAAQVRPADSKTGTITVFAGQVSLQVSATESWALTFTRSELLAEAQRLNGVKVVVYGIVQPGGVYKVYGLVVRRQ